MGGSALACKQSRDKDGKRVNGALVRLARGAVLAKGKVGCNDSDVAGVLAAHDSASGESSEWSASEGSSRPELGKGWVRWLPAPLSLPRRAASGCSWRCTRPGPTCTEVTVRETSVRPSTQGEGGNAAHGVYWVGWLVFSKLVRLLKDKRF